MKRLPARIGLSGISFDCPDGSNGLLRWTELTAFEKTIRPNPLLRRDKDRLPTQIIASSNRINRLAALLRERQLRNEIQLGTHLQEWKIRSSTAEAVLGIFYWVGGPAFGLYFLATMAMKYTQRSSVIAEVDALMPWWYWAGVGVAFLGMIPFFFVLPYLFGSSILRAALSKNQATRVITDANGITAHMRCGEVVSSPWQGIHRIHAFPSMTLILPDRTVYIFPLAREQCLSVIRLAILKSRGNDGAARVFGRRVKDLRLRHPEPISKRMWWGAACVGPMLSGILFLQQSISFPDRPLDISALIIPSICFPLLACFVHLMNILQRKQYARPKKRSHLTLTACF